MEETGLKPKTTSLEVMKNEVGDLLLFSSHP